MTTAASAEGHRRLHSRPWDHDYLLMRGIARALRQLIAQHAAVRTGAASGLTVVDFGCGPMPYKPLFDFPGVRYVGADFPGNPLAEVVIDKRGVLPFEDSSVDVVLSSQVLEHVLDVQAYLNEARRVLKPEGTLLLSTHGNWIYHPHPTDVRRWTRCGLQYDVGKSGFTVTQTIPVLGPLAYATQLQLLMVKGFLSKFGVAGRVVCAPLAMVCQGLMWLEDRITPAWVTADNAAVYVLEARQTG